MTIAHLPPEALRKRYLCSDHFDKKLIDDNVQRKRLKKGSFPEPYQSPEALMPRYTPSPVPSDLKVLAPKSVYRNRNKGLLKPTYDDSEVPAFLRRTPKRRRKYIQFKALLDQTKIVIAKVYHYFEQEYEELKQKYGVALDLSPLSKFRQRTALAVGVSEQTVVEILKEEASRRDEMRQKKKKSRACKRPREPDSSSEEDNVDNNDEGEEDEEQPGSNDEIETLVIKEEPLELYNEEPEIEMKKEPGVSEDNEELADPIGSSSLELKVEPREEPTASNETLAVQRATKSYKGRKTQRNSKTSLASSAPSASFAPRGPSAPSASIASPGPSAPPATFAPPGPSALPGSSARSASPASPRRQLLLLEDGEVKVEKIEIGEEGFS